MRGDERRGWHVDFRAPGKRAVYAEDGLVVVQVAGSHGDADVAGFGRDCGEPKRWYAGGLDRVASSL